MFNVAHCQTVWYLPVPVWLASEEWWTKMGATCIRPLLRQGEDFGFATQLLKVPSISAGKVWNGVRLEEAVVPSANQTSTLDKALPPRQLCLLDLTGHLEVDLRRLPVLGTLSAQRLYLVDDWSFNSAHNCLRERRCFG